MMNIVLVPVVTVLVGFVLLPALIRALSGGSVSRVRVERFARRQALVITPGNGNLVIAYLGTTRRWRVLGLVAGVVLTMAWSLRDSRITVNALTAFAGWFIGALVAEYRIASLEPGARRAASLAPRLLRRRLGTTVRVLTAVLIAVTVGSVVGCVLAAATGRSVELPLVFGYLVAGALTLGLPVLVGRHVLSRPRPLGVAADRQLADDALRDRSLQVLAGCAIALTAFPAANLALTLSRALPDLAIGDSIGVLGLLVLVAGLVLGWAVATRPRAPSASSTSPASGLEVVDQS